VPLQELAEILVTADAGPTRFLGRLTLELDYLGSRFPVTMPVAVAAGTTATVCKVGGTESAPELLEHLNANRLHYNQAIWRSLDASTTALLLSRFRFEDLPVANQIDPNPIMVAGNYLVFRMPGFLVRRDGPRRTTRPGSGAEDLARQTWNEWLTDKGLTFGPESTTEELVPVPTGGVFAEAVPGRSNSAEKLDATRFWNWQDSPIPLQPPEIAAINLQSRAQPVDVRPGQLGQPVLNIVNPTGLPDPTGLGPLLGALQNGNMFRDMSGLAATIGLAQATASNATSAAADAAKLAAANMAVAAQHDIETKRLEVARAAAGNPAAMGGSPKNISEMGSLINAAGARDAARSGRSTNGVAGGGGGGGGGGGSGSGSGGGGGDTNPGGESGTGSSATSNGSADSLSDQAFERALWGELGMPAAKVALNGAPGPSKKPAPAPLIVDEIYAHGAAAPPPEWSTVADEVAALDSSQWRPTDRDFGALARKMVIPSNVKRIATLRDFIHALPVAAHRTNLYTYALTKDAIGLTVEIDAGAFGGKIDPPSALVSSRAITKAHLTALIAEMNANPSSSLALDLKEILDAAATRPNRQLWLYLCGGTVDDSLVQAIANTFKIRTFTFREEIRFFPEYTTTPPDIKDRARFGIGTDLAVARTTVKDDPYAFDGLAKRFDPKP
jgi:hypothetical protein